MPEDAWTSGEIRDRLKLNRSKGLDSAAQVFLDTGVPDNELGGTVKKAIGEAASRLGRAPDVTIGKIRALAKSASVTGDPDVIAEMLNEPAVRAILPSALDDVYPKPHNVKIVE